MNRDRIDGRVDLVGFSSKIHNSNSEIPRPFSFVKMKEMAE